MSVVGEIALETGTTTVETGLNAVLEPFGEVAASQIVADLALEARSYARAAKAPATLRAYAADWRHFSAWRETHGRDALPASPEGSVALTGLRAFGRVR